MAGLLRRHPVALAVTVPLALAVLLGVIGYRVLVPREVLDPAWQPYPPPAQAAAGVYGALLAAPIVVDGRLRVYAAADRVWADQPVDIKSSMTPYWVLRRWPEQLLGVVAVGRTVVSQWSDGALVALSAVSGRVAWRARVPVGRALAYPGRRTGAAAVYEPWNLSTVDGMVAVGGSTGITVLDAATGGTRWHVGGGCRGQLFTAASMLFCPVDGGVTGVYDAATGAGAPVAWPAGLRHPRPFGCAPARAQCQGVRDGGRAWLIGPGATLTEQPALADPGAVLVAGTVVRAGPDGTVSGTVLGAGTPAWTWRGTGAAATVLAAQPGAVHLLTADFDLVTLDPATGAVRSGFWLLVLKNTRFTPGHVYAADRFVFIERLNPGEAATGNDSAYYHPSPAVLVAGT